MSATEWRAPAKATVAWPCSVSWPFWLVHLTSRSISFSPFSSRLPVTLPLTVMTSPTQVIEVKRVPSLRMRSRGA